jgi:hypothetical protein
MPHPPPSREDSLFPLADFPSSFPRVLLLFEKAVRDVLSDFWDEPLRFRASELAQALFEGCSLCGYKSCARTLRAMASLLSLGYGDACAIRTPLVEKLNELLRQLFDQAQVTESHGRRFGM